MPVATCSAISAGPLASTTQATDGDGLAGSWGAANTAPSGLSAAVTRSAANGSGIGAPGCNGPVVDTGGSVEAGVAVVVAVVEVPEDAAVVVVDVWREELGVGGPELQAASSNGAAIAVTNPNCRCRPRSPRMAATMA